MKICQLSKIFVLLLIAGLMTSADYSQASRGNSVPNKKANQRPSLKSDSGQSRATDDKTEDPIEADGDILTIDTNLVTLPVRVLDRQGRFVPGLIREDFSVFEDKTEQQIEYFSNEQSPFTVALVLDMSYSSTFKINEIQRAALTFVSKLRPDDSVMIVSFDGEIHILSEPTSDRKALEQAIIRTRIGSGTSLYETVDFVINKRFSKMTGRKSIVLFTDGVDTTSRITSDRNNLDDAMEFDALIYPIRYDTYADVRAIEEGRVIIKDTSSQTTPPIGGGGIPGSMKSPLPFPIPTGTIGTGQKNPSRIPGSGTTKEEYLHAEEYLNEMALRTGGRVYQANDPSTLARAFSQIASELREFYSIGYYPNSESSAKRVRNIKVRVNRDKVAVKTRDSYVIGRKDPDK